MDKGIGFNRNIFLHWLDATASFRQQTADADAMRDRLEPVVGQRISSAENQRKAIDILNNIWIHSRDVAPMLHDEAVSRFGAAEEAETRLWLHYGMVLLAYPFFREAAAVVGQLGRRDSLISSGEVKRRLTATRGQLGSLNKAVERVVFSLREWDMLEEANRRHHYTLRERCLETDDASLQAWLVACALTAHPAEELPYLDLVRLPELFAFRISLGLDALRTSGHFAVSRQGGGWEAVRLAR